MMALKILPLSFVVLAKVVRKIMCVVCFGSTTGFLTFWSCWFMLRERVCMVRCCVNGFLRHAYIHIVRGGCEQTDSFLPHPVKTNTMCTVVTLFCTVSMMVYKNVSKLDIQCELLED